MSVMAKSQDFFKKIENTLISLYNRADWNPIDNSSVFKRYKEMQGNYDPPTKEELRKQIIQRLMWYMYVSNCIAYSLNYQEEPGFFAPEESTTTQRITHNVTLLKEMEHLQYNIYTNDGNCFVEPDFYKLYQDIINDIKSRIVRTVPNFENL